MERKIHFRKNWLIFLGIRGDAEIISMPWGAKEKYFHGVEELSFRDLGRSMYYLQGLMEHRPHGGLISPTGRPNSKITLGTLTRWYSP